MKEQTITIEEKAKAYDEALEQAKRWHKAFVMGHNYPATDIKVSYEIMFPELTESEDDKIVAAIRKALESKIEDLGNGVTKTACINWLEKQGEQEQDPCEHCKDKCLNCHNFPCIEKRAFEQGKSVFDVINEEKVDNADKVEPKFKVGDWITNGDYTWKIVEVKPLDYILQSQDGNIVDDTISHVDEQFHSFTIQDAKDGDILAENKGNVILMFRGIGNTEWDDVIDYHCYYDCYRKDFIVQEDVEYWGDIKNNQLKPATKEQRDLLFTKMKEAGYMWDAEKKELKKFAKFNVGDWIINNDVYGDVPIKIKEIGNYLYLCERQDGVIIELNKDAVLKEFKHWDITDAKDGDVLAVEPIEGFPSSFIAIYKKQNEEDFDSYCFVGFDGKFYEADTGHSTEEIHPATKEQRELLFKKMHEASYEWDAEKKELKKIEEELTDFENSLKHIMIETLECGDTHNLKADADLLLRIAQKSYKSYWSKEDEKIYQSIIDDTVQENQLDIKQINWIESLKYRVQSKSKQEWCYEDNSKINSIKYLLHELGNYNFDNYLESLCPQNTWKPSEEQINMLFKYAEQNNKDGNILTSLYQDLKKLTE